MLRDLKMQQGHISNKVFITKRMECSILVFAAFYFMITSIVFVWFYHTKLDAVNFDNYDLFNDAIESNDIGPVDDNVYLKDGLNFMVNNTRCSPQNYSIRVRPGFLFTAAFDRVFLAKRVRHDYIVKYYHCAVSQTQSFTVRATLSAERDEESREYSQEFTFLNFYPSYNSDTGATIQKYISGIHLTFYSFNMEGRIIDGFSNDISLDYVDQYVDRINIYIHCANEYLPYDMPAFSYILVMAISFVLFLLGALFIILFLWHCWSYKYVLIKRAIIESGIHFER